MPTVNKEEFIDDGWKEHYSGYPADLFYSGDYSTSPWAVVPHLHVNYAISGELQSVTFKDVSGRNTYLFRYGSWSSTGWLPEPFLRQVQLIQQMP